MDGVSSTKLADWLFQTHQIFVTTATFADIDGIRVSPQIFNTPAELDRLVAALRLACAGQVA